MHSHSLSSSPRLQPPLPRERHPLAERSSLAGITRSHSSSLASALVLVFAVATSGCVASGDHQLVVAERDGLAAQQKRLEERVRHLEASNKALTDELDATLEQYEDLNIERDDLVTAVSNLETKEQELSTALTETSAELETSQQKLEVATTEVVRLTSTYTQLMSDLEAEVSSGQIQIEQLREGIRVNVSDEILFASGSAELDPIGRTVLEKVTEQLKGIDHDIEVQGHTDDRRIRGRLAKRYPSNWELAAARAARVVRLMQERGIAGERLRVVSLASFQPIASNATPQDRSLNRRIEIRLQPRPPGAGPAGPASGAEQPGAGG